MRFRVEWDGCYWWSDCRTEEQETCPVPGAVRLTVPRHDARFCSEEEYDAEVRFVDFRVPKSESPPRWREHGTNHRTEQALSVRWIIRDLPETVTVWEVEVPSIDALMALVDGHDLILISKPKPGCPLPILSLDHECD